MNDSTVKSLETMQGQFLGLMDLFEEQQKVIKIQTTLLEKLTKRIIKLENREYDIKFN